MRIEKADDTTFVVVSDDGRALYTVIFIIDGDNCNISITCHDSTAPMIATLFDDVKPELQVDDDRLICRGYITATYFRHSTED